MDSIEPFRPLEPTEPTILGHFFTFQPMEFTDFLDFIKSMSVCNRSATILTSPRRSGPLPGNC